jgi:hypothetical protein
VDRWLCARIHQHIPEGVPALVFVALSLMVFVADVGHEARVCRRSPRDTQEKLLIHTRTVSLGKKCAGNDRTVYKSPALFGRSKYTVCDIESQLLLFCHRVHIDHTRKVGCHQNFVSTSSFTKRRPDAIRSEQCN